MKDPAPLFRALFKHVRSSANLPGLLPRPLQANEIVPGTAEFVVTRGRDLPGGGWMSAGLIVPRRYPGYVAVHYAADTDQHSTFGDEVAIRNALISFGLLPQVREEPAFRQMGDTPSDWFLNKEPDTAGKPPVLTLALDWHIELDLTVQEGPPP